MISRLKEDLIEAGQYGRDPERRVEYYDQLDPERGVVRPTGTVANKKVRDYAVKRMREVGLEIKFDKVGNIFARKEGSKTDRGVIMCGSHLDSVTNGGQFDGALGVFAAIEAVRRIDEEGFDNERPIEVAVLTSEEGSVFGLTLLGSSTLIGKVSVDDALKLKNPAGRTLAEILEQIGYRGDFERDLSDIENFVEMHIEQGPVLYNERIPIGIVENIVGIAWIFATIKGAGNHAGTTPMKMRKDALVAAADIVSFVKRRASEIGEELGSATVGTVGKLTVYPNGTNIVPARVDLGIDIRDVVSKNMEDLKNETVIAIRNLEERYGVEVELNIPTIHLPAPLAPEVVNVIAQSASMVGIKARRMNSGAGHDTQNLAERVKAGMIFVPSVNGISHAPMEWTEWDDIESGTKVLVHTLKTLSKLER